MSLSPKEQRRIRVKTDDDFSKDELLSEYRKLKSEIYEVTKSKNIHAQNFDKFKTRSRLISSTLGICVLLFTLSTLHQYFNKPNPQKTFKEYFKAYTNDRTINEGIQAFVKGDYKKAILTLPNDSTVIRTNWLKIYSYIEEEDFKSAAELLSNYSTEEEKWLYALCLLASENLHLAYKTFDEIYSEKGVYSPLSRKILEKHYSNSYYH